MYYAYNVTAVYYAIVDGAWSEWSSWGICIARPCSGQVGYRDRVRTCNNPQPQYGGKRCGDLAKMWETQTETCYNMDGCSNKSKPLPLTLKHNLYVFAILPLIIYLYKGTRF